MSLNDLDFADRICGIMTLIASGIIAMISYLGYSADPDSIILLIGIPLTFLLFVIGILHFITKK